MLMTIFRAKGMYDIEYHKAARISMNKRTKTRAICCFATATENTMINITK